MLHALSRGGNQGTVFMKIRRWVAAALVAALAWLLLRIGWVVFGLDVDAGETLRDLYAWALVVVPVAVFFGCLLTA
jgi:hypothetical protein